MTLTSEMLRDFSDGEAMLSAVARGRPQWLREPPPRIQSVRVYIRSRGTAMAKLPDAEQALVVRTDFSDQATWEAVQRDITQLIDGFQAYVHFVDDREFSGLSVPELVKAAGHDRSYVMVVDRTTIESADHPVLVIDLFDEPGRTFRALPSSVQAIENNLSIANMDFEEFARAVGKDGIFRGFPTF